MINKKLEKRLIDSGYSECIPIIEICEVDPMIKEIEVDVKGFTDSEVLNRMIETYLKKFNIKIKRTNIKKKLKEIANETSNLPKVFKQKCKNAVHVPFKNELNLEAKKKIYQNYKMKMFSIDDDVYVVCPDCHLFEKL